MHKLITTLLYTVCFITPHVHAGGTKKLYVNDHRVMCGGRMQCIEVKEKTKAAWYEFSDTIIGFDYHEGYKYTLEVEVIAPKDPYAGRMTETYKLVKIISKKKTVNQSVQQLEGQKCILLTLYDTHQTLTMHDSAAFVIFKVRDGRILGHGVCNSFGGAAKFDGHKVKISDLVSTKVFCQGNELEDVITKFLSNTVSWVVENDVLTLVCSDGSKLSFWVRHGYI